MDDHERIWADPDVPVDDDVDETIDDTTDELPPGDLVVLGVDLDLARVDPGEFKEWADAAAAR